MMQLKRNIAIVIVASFFTTIFSITPASAADYRYWTFWVTTSDQWSSAQEGAGTLMATDQMVTGWKFAITGVDPGTPPAESAVFAELCPDTAEQAGGLRVAIVVDLNDQAVAPEGEVPPSQNVVSCVTINDGQTALDALAAADLEIRESSGLICGINGYPKEECGVEITSTTSEPSEMVSEEDTAPVVTSNEEMSESSNSNFQLIGLAAVLVVALAVILKMRKKK